MNAYQIALWILCSFYIRESTCVIDPLSITASIAAGSGILFGYKYAVCKFYECCDDAYIPQNINELEKRLENNLYGQNIAIHSIISALRAHSHSELPNKALTLAFHGSPGTGKNYVAGMIRDSFYKNGISSKYYHFFNGRSEFPLKSKTHLYQDELRNTIVKSLEDCPKSMFVFDEIDDMADGVLDVLVQFLDYGPTQVMVNSQNKVVETRYAIFIFLCNAGSSKIVDKLMELWLLGKSRDEASLADFEKPIAIGAFNGKGGFYKSDTIRSSLIDHYIPFLPLEQEHIILCIKEEFTKYGIPSPDNEQIENVISYLTFGPEPHNLFVTSGCKRIQQKVANIAYRRKSHL
ncbi:hypothetical protein PV328_005384 [Microctonus aethiopoides]|uniref:Torsin-1A C-terminal domain-containing protein n=1 Tax=Microctonus aethiopoides TaxID=144406 RepID=A0AA39FLW5_9HYME|nr:hypothetical protein PV328_005384 [Microctonus aethiopoides]